MSTRYLEVRDKLKASIENLPPHTAIARERELVEQFGVSRMTLRRAISELADEGFLYAVRGHGTFVAEPRIRKGAELTTFSEDMRARGFTPNARVITAVVRVVPEHIAPALELEPGSQVFELYRVRLADDVPMCLETSYLPAHFFPGLTEHDLTASLHEILHTRYRTRAVQSDHRMKAVTLTKTQADLLSAKRGSPALEVRRITTDDRGRLIEHATSLYRGDRYHFDITFVRNKSGR
jgi:GntR family transcriptional regulator